MKAKNISLKWIIFITFLTFAVVLLGVLWFFQVVYLNDFYVMIKRNETESVLAEVESILYEGDDIDKKIDKLAAKNNMAVFVTDNTGCALYNAEYIHNSQMSSLPYGMFLDFYNKAKENGGSVVIEYEGSKLKEELEDHPFQPDEDMIIFEDESDDGRLPYTVMDDKREPRPFVQNMGNDMAQSVIYVKTLELNNQDVVIMVNAVLTPVDSVVGTLKTELMIISLVMVLVAFIAAFVISSGISRSIVDINNGAKRLAKGEYDTVFNIRDYRELSELSDTLNYAASELGKTDALQKELIANVSHDLRTPLTMIKGYAEVMRDLPGENTPENVQVIIDETEYLSGLVSDMLDISKLQAGSIELELDEYNITESIRQVLNRYNKLREVDGYVIDFEYDDEVLVVADEKKMYQVLYNLINNAINYAGEDKRVIVSQKVTDDRLCIEVMDNGAGIKKEDIPYVWDRYYKDKKNHVRAVQGTGLGLAIVKSILDLHKACYGVNSTEGHGATFWFELKL